MTEPSSSADRPDGSEKNPEPQRESQADLGIPSGQASSGDTQVKPRNVGPVPAFLDRTYSMVDEDDSADIVAWGESGDTFVIKRLDLFEEEVIPRFFNHRNLFSFVRQLNNHGFSKVRQGQSRPVTSGQSSTTVRGAGGHSRTTATPRGKQDPNVWWEFKHPNFQRGRRELMCEIKRRRERPSSSAGPGPSSVSEEVVNLMRRQIENIEGGLRIVDAKLDELKDLVVKLSSPQGPHWGSTPPDYPVPESDHWGPSPRGRGSGGTPGGAGPTAADFSPDNGGGSEGVPSRREGPGAERVEEYYTMHRLMRQQQRTSQQQHQQEPHWWYHHHHHPMPGHVWQSQQRKEHFGGRDLAGPSEHPSEMGGSSRPADWPPSAQGSSHGTPPDDPPWPVQSSGFISGVKRKAYRPSTTRADGAGDSGSMSRAGYPPIRGGGDGGMDDVDDGGKGRMTMHDASSSPSSIVVDSYAAARAQAQYDGYGGRGGKGHGPYMFYQQQQGPGGIGEGAGRGVGASGRSAGGDVGPGRSFGRSSSGVMGSSMQHHGQSIASSAEISREADFFSGGRGWRISSGGVAPLPVGSPTVPNTSVRGDSRSRAPVDPKGAVGERSLDDSPVRPMTSTAGVGRVRERDLSPPRSRIKRDVDERDGSSRRVPMGRRRRGGMDEGDGRREHNVDGKRDDQDGERALKPLGR